MSKELKLGYFIPIFVMVSLSVLVSILADKSLMVIALVLLIPLAFLIEGWLCGLKDKGFLVPLVLSTMCALVGVVVALNNSANIYAVLYAIIFCLGYVLGLGVAKIRAIRQSKVLTPKN
ncbi:MAG: hypothetical protein ACRC1D_03615 [Culicoidibacterales bacterium]